MIAGLPVAHETVADGGGGVLGRYGIVICTSAQHSLHETEEDYYSAYRQTKSRIRMTNAFTSGF